MNTSSGTTTSIEFDVRALNARLNARKPWNRLFLVGMTLFAVGLFIASLIRWAQSGFVVQESPRWLVLVIATGVFAALLVRLAYRSRAVDYPTADAVSLGPEGVVLRYPETGVRTLRWTDDRMSFELLEYDWAVMQALGSTSPTRFTLISDGRLTVIDEAAYRAILEAAEYRGLARPKAMGHLTIGNPKITLVQGRSLA